MRIKINGEYWNLDYDTRKNLQGCYGLAILPNQDCETKGCTPEKLCVLCSRYQDRDIIIANNLDEYDEFGTIIHEIMHAILPDYKEKFIDEASNSLTEALWKLGFRKTDT